MTREQAIEARRTGARVEWWDRVRGGWRRGVVVRVPNHGGMLRVVETGQTRSRHLLLDQVRPEVQP